ncbi:potassium transporter TrkA [Dactylosporangium sp. CA-139114]|uniref:potassium transporter TrkA n=1 Tax=Dactylosporangium sp. CA-139114 TaxID=3239931 RepID=UPI003D980662
MIAPGSQRPLRLVVIGSGALARVVCYTLAGVCTEPMTILILGRAPQRLADLCFVAQARATASGVPVSFTGMATDITDPASIAPALRGTAEGVVLVCASEQSPWEAGHQPSAWTAFVRRAGYGVTLPLQATVALAAARALQIAKVPMTLVNACLPDAVNPALAALGLPLLCGVGNVATLTASLRAALATAADGHTLRVVAHHAHLHTPEQDADELRAWLDDTEVQDVTTLLRPQRDTDRGELNQVTGHVAALFLLDLIRGAGFAANVPGPLGLAGGYPVRITGDRVELDLPAALPLATAVDSNRQAGLRDGIDIHDGRADFGPAAASLLHRHRSPLAGGFALSELPSARRELLTLRDALRRQPEVKDDHHDHVSHDAGPAPVHKS